MNSLDLFEVVIFGKKASKSNKSSEKGSNMSDYSEEDVVSLIKSVQRMPCIEEEQEFKPPVAKVKDDEAKRRKFEELN
jgi:hypothetical protein